MSIILIKVYSTKVKDLELAIPPLIIEEFSSVDDALESLIYNPPADFVIISAYSSKPFVRRRHRKWKDGSNT